jgi:hypothetical protein
MAVFVLPCGLSILDNLRKGDKAPAGVNRPAATVAQLVDWAVQSQLRNPNDALDQWLRTDPTRRVLGAGPDGLALQQWPAEELSAELASLAAGNVEPGFGPQHRVVLLASDTEEGILAGLLNATRLGQQEVRYHPTPPTVLEAGQWRLVREGGQAGTAPIDVVRIPRLLPDTNASFPEATGHVAGTLLWAAEQPEVGTHGIVLHLAGGYKATLPFLLVMAEYVRERARSLPEGMRPVSVWCKHERGTEAIRIPLRRVNLGDLDLLQQIKDGSSVGSGSGLRDFAFDGQRLNQMGEALLLVRGVLRLGDRPVP